MKVFKAMASIGLKETVKSKSKPEPEVGEGASSEEQQRQEMDSFLRLLANIYEQNERACRWQITDPTDPTGRHKIKAEGWLAKTKAFMADVPNIGNFELPVTGHLELPGGFKTSDITFEQKRVSIDLSVFADDPNAMILNALALALTASASKEMRRKGVVIEADTPEEEAALYMACQALGLRVKKAPEVDPQIMQKAQQDMGQAWGKFAAAMNGQYDFSAEQQAETVKETTEPENTKADAHEDENKETQENVDADSTVPAESMFSTGQHPVTARHLEEMRVPTDKIGLMRPETQGTGAPRNGTVSETNNATTGDRPKASPAKISETFNANVLPEPIAAKLDILNIDPELYKKIRSTVVETQDARRNTLKNAFSDDGLKTSQVTAIVETLDQEGITSPQDRPGTSRRVNYNADGTPKPPQVL